MEAGRTPRLLDSEIIAIPEMPPRSYFYHLPPIGIGTPFAESLASYIARLADAHGVRSGTLLRLALTASQSVFARQIQDEAKRDKKIESGYLFNGFGPLVNAWLDIFSELTLRRDLGPTTLARFENVFSTKGLRRLERAWCPLCLAEWQTQGLPIYEPLAWSLENVKCCAIHGVPLETVCPSNGCSHLPHVGWRISPGVCSRCNGWLGLPENGTVPTSALGVPSFQQWAAEEIGQLVALLPFNFKQTYSVNEMLARGIDKLYRGNAAAFGKAIGKSKTTVWTWQNEPVLLSLRDILHICRTFQLSVTAFLQGDISCWGAAIQPEPAESSRKGKAKRIDWRQVEEYMRKVLDGSITPLPSVSEIAKRFDTDLRNVKDHLPDMSRQISDRFKAHLAENARLRLENEKARIRQAMIEIAKDGMLPTRRRVAGLLRCRPDFFRNTERNALWRTLYEEIVPLSKCGHGESETADEQT